MESPQAPTPPYLVIAADAPAAPAQRGVMARWKWKKIALAVIGGGLLGGVIGLLQPGPEKTAPAAGTVTSIATAAPVESEDVVRLKARNRRLEALVWVLKHRNGEARQAR